MVSALLEKIERKHPFTDNEAWTLFKIAAIGEACGWTLLISGILIKHYFTPGNNIPVLVAGRIHGVIFLTYITAVLVLYSSLRWSRPKTIVAALASVPPYGSLVFEQWAAHKRRSEALKTYREVVARGIIIQGNKLLAVQTKDNVFWSLPGGIVKAGESIEQSLSRTVLSQTKIRPTIERLVYVLQYRDKTTERLEMFFNISNAIDYKEHTLIQKTKSSKVIDEISYLDPKNNQNIMPEFLQKEPIIATSKKHNSPVVSITG